ncbi:hypothetical protein PIB30_078749 [Stylosanthes scabra]|uniref:Uncharacterized protein n=1 Tax=Stylosanthes scabra TaxID=79078 RepID=A0ABU6ZPR6_9FABA|nr:hypothetical protein [Stylosanthes scabra]
MGPVNFTRVRAALRELKGTNEEPKRFEVFIATRTSCKRKELDEGIQTAIEQPGRVRCYGRSTTQTLKSELEDVKIQQQQQAEDIHRLRSMVKLLLLRFEPDMRPEEVDAMLPNAQNSPVDANSGHGSTHHARNVSTVGC